MPHPRVLDYITPTQVIDGDECLWRLGFSCDPETSDLSRSGPAAALGQAAHEVRSRLGDPLGFDDVWSEAVSRAYNALTLQWSPAVPPSSENWPGWSLTKVRLKRLWERNASATTATRTAISARPKSKRQGLPRLPWRERWIHHHALPLAGRPDLVEQFDDTMLVVDFKTGLKQAEPTDQQRTQLLLYCALVTSELGERPNFAAVESTSGQRFTFTTHEDTVDDAVDHALATLDRLNSSGGEGLHESLARPSETACGWCPFRPVCGPFFNAYNETWAIAHALLFRIQSVRSSEHGYEVEATVLRPHWRVDEDVHIVGFPFGLEPCAGEVWGAVDFAGRSTSAVAAWNTRLARWHQ